MAWFQRRMSKRRLVALLVMALFVAMLIYGARVQRVRVHAADGQTVKEELRGGDLIRASVRQTIVRDPESKVIVEKDAPAAECPT
ncbi:MAG: hypothetical protein JXR37_15445 [Kiritimatiellae bacterium]|nr:hypothetical protein [Kiritimatiellia bacterium]